MFERDDVMLTWTEQVDPAHTALVMVDLQNDFVDPDGWVATQQVPGFLGDTGITTVVQRAAALLDSAREHGVPTIFVRMLGDDRYLSGPLLAQYRRNHGHERPTCVQEGPWGADWHPSVAPDGRDGEFVVDKHRYSAFIGTRLDLLLRSHGVRSIVVCGVATSGCVESTIRDGFMLDYYVVIAGDACGDYDAARHQATLTKMDLSFGTVVSVDDVGQTWAKQVAPRADRPVNDRHEARSVASAAPRR
jgi:ureidoacrylate peracid hydrolase